MKKTVIAYKYVLSSFFVIRIINLKKKQEGVSLRKLKTLLLTVEGLTSKNIIAVSPLIINLFVNFFEHFLSSDFK